MGKSEIGEYGLLAPIVRWWALSADRAREGVLRPTDAPHARALGHDPDRVLLVGGGLAAGRGVASHDLALTGCLARALSACTGRGCDVDVVAAERMSLAAAMAALRRLNVSLYDAIVVMPGARDASLLTSPQRWREGMASLLRHLAASAQADTTILVTGIQPVRSTPRYYSLLGAIADRRATALNQETASACAGSPRATYLPLELVPESLAGGLRHEAAAEYARWGSFLASSLAPLLAAETRPRESRRGWHHPRVAATELRLQEPTADRHVRADAAPRLAHVLELARRVFLAESAAIVLPDGEGHRTLAQVGIDQQDAADRGVFFDLAIRGSGATVIRDVGDDPRFSRHPDGVPGIRFYAGFPIESASGARIGVLAVTDPHPRRRATDIDDVLLRELAGTVQREVWRSIADAQARDGLEHGPCATDAPHLPIR